MVHAKTISLPDETEPDAGVTRVFQRLHYLFDVMQRASRINGHLAPCSLRKRNTLQRGKFASIPCWTSLTAVFPISIIYGHR
jgi:hypothetical protein